MSRKGKEWNWYHRGGNKNARFFDVWCNYCLNYEKLNIMREEMQMGLTIGPGDEIGDDRLLELAKNNVPSFAGRKETMLNHLIDPQKCKSAPPEIRRLAHLEKMEWKQRLRGDHYHANSAGSSSRSSSQSPYAAHIPPPIPSVGIIGAIRHSEQFTSDSERIFHLHVARATASAGLPDHWIEDPEVVKLFRLLHPAVTIPSAAHIKRLQEFMEWERGSDVLGYQ